jgi:hypothetical protein
MSWEKIRPNIHAKWKSYWYQIHPHDIAEYSWTYLFTGGKEIRARLFCELWSYLSPGTPINGELAFAIECIHTASLILDDMPWMDNASTRRGKPTLHLTFSNKKAALLCHDIMFMVYTIWNENKPANIPLVDWERFIIHKLQRLMIGQWYDLEQKGTLFDLASLKTGVLFEFVTETVAWCNELYTDVWRLWGNHLGILFQWMDDWNDREEDILQENRNAFNESYHTTLSMYNQIWNKLERGIGPSWFTRPFGAFMKQYFTKDIPLSLFISGISLSDLLLPYPTPPLPYFTTIPPELEPYNKTDLSAILRDPNRVIRINERNLFDMERSNIEQLIRSKQRIHITINDHDLFELDRDDLFQLEIVEWINLFNENKLTKINGKQIIRNILRLTNRVDYESYRARYLPLYESWKQKIWAIHEDEWEHQSECIDILCDEIQRLKDGISIL